MDFSPATLVNLMLQLSKDIDDAQDILEKAVHVEADAQDALINARAEAWKKVEGRSREERDAYVDQMTRVQKVNYTRAVGLSKASLEKVRNKRQELSALQTAGNSIREEAALARTGPQ